MQTIAELLLVHSQGGPTEGAVLKVRQDYDEDDYYAGPVFLVTNADADRTFAVESAALGGMTEAWGGFRIGHGGPTWTRCTGTPSADEPMGSLCSAMIDGESRLYFNVSGGAEGWVAVTA